MFYLKRYVLFRFVEVYAFIDSYILQFCKFLKSFL